MVRENPNINKLNIFDKNYQLTAFPDDTRFLLVILPPLTESLRVSTFLSKYFGLKLNTSKCEICGFGVKNYVTVALCGFKNVILTVDSIRLGIHFSYN